MAPSFASDMYQRRSDPLAFSPPTFKAHKSLPHRHANAAPQRAGSLQYHKREDYDVSSWRPHSLSMPGAFPANGWDSMLPPTPPRYADTLSRHDIGTEKPPKYQSDYATARKQAEQTVVNGRGPPTPDATPPSTSSLVIPVREGIAALSPSSCAESFKTAREDPWPSDEEGELTPLNLLPSPAGDLIPLDSANLDGLGLDLQREEESSTPTPKKIKTRAKRTSHLDHKTVSAVPNNGSVLLDVQFDPESMRNVTIRRKKLSNAPKAKAGGEEKGLATREVVTKLPSQSSAEDMSTSRLHESSPNVDPPRYTWPEDKIRRKSEHSRTSSIIEAVIVASPPQRQRTLRHVSKTVALRSGSSAALAIADLTRSSMKPSALSMRKVSDKWAASDYVHGSLAPEAPSVLLRHHDESRSLRSHYDMLDRDGFQGSRDVVRSSSDGSSHHRTLSGSGTNGLPHANGFAKRHSLPSAIKYRIKTYSPRIGSELPKDVFDRSVPSNNAETMILATRRALQKLHETDFTMHDSRLSFGRSLEPAYDKVSIVANNDIPPNARLEAGHKTEAMHGVEYLTPEELDPPLPSRSTFEGATRVSFDDSTITTHEMHRASNASSNLRADSEHANARHLYSQTTPFSQFSEPHELSEATAVSIYPHHNESLVVVQQFATRITDMPPRHAPQATSGLSRPTLTVEAATPPRELATPVNVDSPLTNPRRPPPPPQPLKGMPLVVPAINIHPATPAEERDGMGFHEQVSIRRTSPPVGTATRPQSLIQRARRYSDNVMRPIIERTSSLRRDYLFNPRSSLPSVDREDPSSSSNLHPFWQPRYTYILSDSDSEWDGNDHGDSRLPAGGDTTDLGEPRGFAKVMERTGLSRGLGGRSLGYELPDISKWKQSLAVPASLGPRKRVVQRKSNGTLRALGNVGRASPPPSKLFSSMHKSKQSIENLRRMASGAKAKRWDPRNWRIEYVGIEGVRDYWRQRQNEKKRAKLKKRIGTRFLVEGGPLRN